MSKDFVGIHAGENVFEVRWQRGDRIWLEIPPNLVLADSPKDAFRRFVCCQSFNNRKRFFRVNFLNSNQGYYFEHGSEE